LFLFILAILFAIAGIIAILAAGLSKDYAAGWRVGGVVAVIFALLVFMVSGIKSVPTKSIGVATSFGKVTGQPYGPGIHETWQPWKHVNIIDETIQTTTFEVDQKTGRGGLDVRIGGQQTARLDVTIQWRVLDTAADGLFSNYANQGPLMGEIQNAVVVRELKQVVNQVMGDYNPIQDVAANSAVSNSQFSTFGPKVLAAMRHDIGGRISVISVLMPLAHYDSSTQARLNTIQAQYAETAIAKQQVITNEAVAAANQKLAASVSHDPNVLVAQCLQITQAAIKAGYNGLPAGWNCFGGGANSLALGK
jgi:regulator of protease activity HflC (stomatin/prohibitin superfamily)